MKNKLKSFFTEHWKYMAVSTACKLHLFDNLQEFKTVQELASQLLLNQEKLSVLLNALYTIGFLEKQSDKYKVNETSILLTENHPESLKYACLNWFDEHLTTWQQLDFSIQTGKSAFENIYGMSFLIICVKILKS